MSTIAGLRFRTNLTRLVGVAMSILLLNGNSQLAQTQLVKPKAGRSVVRASHGMNAGEKPRTVSWF